jgi:tetratricopeptide (TPR) repeat protein
MGKSLQGGSGILVLGSILYAILKRLEFRREDQNKSPETWLKYLALELQELYESFQGSMLISGVFGLIDEKNGVLYYINFEHPYPVIYRNGKAFFIGENYILFKIGMPRTFQQNIKIQIYELNENDIFIVGSDGKDDIEIEVNHNKYKNEDETLFLRIVEQSEGDIKLMINYLKKTGSLTDDISILSFHTIKKEIPIIDNIPANNGKEIKERIIALIKNKEFQKVYNVLKPYVEEYPFDTYLLYYYFVSLYQLGHIEKAIEIGEQIINRIDAPLKVYLLLIKSYIKVRYYIRAESLLNEYKKISTNNLDKIQELEKILHQDKQIRTDKL